MAVTHKGAPYCYRGNTRLPGDMATTCAKALRAPLAPVSPSWPSLADPAPRGRSWLAWRLEEGVGWGGRAWKARRAWAGLGEKWTPTSSSTNPPASLSPERVVA